jgi:hypothetical protein
MKACLVATLPLLVASYAAAQPPYTEKQVIDYAKSIDVQTLDPSLPSQRLEVWLQTGLSHAHSHWEVADSCDNKPDDLTVDYPLCAKVWFSRNGEAGSFLVEVGTRRKGIRGLPRLYNEILCWEDGGGWIMTGDVEKLSELPALLDQPPFAHGVGQLYGEIVTRHPLGIPAVGEMATIRPETHLVEKRPLHWRWESCLTCLCMACA